LAQRVDRSGLIVMGVSGIHPKHGVCRRPKPAEAPVAGTGFEAAGGWGGDAARKQEGPVRTVSRGSYLVRIPEAEILARPDLWTPEGLAEHLREHGIDPGQPYRQHEDDETGSWLFVQEPLAA
jgi:hypothetical protein